MTNTISVLDHGYVTLRNIAGPTRRPSLIKDGVVLHEQFYDADDVDPANAARFSFDGADADDRTREEDLKLASYLMKNDHTTPFEMITIWLEMQMPIFVARQFVRHRTVSINEVSARYTKLPDRFYIPDEETIGMKSASNKQGRDANKFNPIAGMFAAELIVHCREAYELYEKYLEADIAPELARMCLPLNIYTKWLWKQDLHNMMHFLRLRDHSHAQYESRQYAKAIDELLREVLPHSMELYDKYRRQDNG